MKKADRNARLKRLRELIKLLRQNAGEGHMPYATDALELIVDLLEPDEH